MTQVISLNNEQGGIEDVLFYGDLDEVEIKFFRVGEKGIPLEYESSSDPVAAISAPGETR